MEQTELEEPTLEWQGNGCSERVLTRPTYKVTGVAEETSSLLCLNESKSESEVKGVYGEVHISFHNLTCGPRLSGFFV